MSTQPAYDRTAPRKQPHEYSRNPSAAYSRERKAAMTPEENRKDNARQSERRAALKLAKKTAGSKNLTEDMQQPRGLGGEGQYRPSLENQQHTAPDVDTTGTTCESNSSLEQYQSDESTTSPEIETTESQEVPEDPSNAEEQNQFADDENHVKQEHATEDTTLPRRTSGGNRRGDQQHQNQPPQCFSTHPALGLAKAVGALSTKDANIAGALFVLIREKHGRTGDHVEGVVRLFAPTRKRLKGVMAILEKMNVTFDEAERDASKYEAFVQDLDEGKAKDARTFLDVSKGSFKDRVDFAEILDDIFLPLKQRKTNEHATTCALLSGFEKIDRAVDQEWY